MCQVGGEKTIPTTPSLPPPLCMGCSTCMAPLPLHRRTRGTDDLDTVPLHVGDERRHVGRSLGRRRQRQRQGGLAEPGVPEVLLRTTRREHNEHADHLGLEDERVGDAARREDKRSGGCPVGLVTYVERDFTLKHVPRLVLVPVNVTRRLRAFAAQGLDQGESPARLPGIRQDVEKVPHVPHSRPRFHPAPEPHRPDTSNLTLHALAPFPNCLTHLVRLPVYKNKVSCLSCQGVSQKYSGRVPGGRGSACRGCWVRVSARWTGSCTRGWWRPGSGTCVLPTTRC